MNSASPDFRPSAGQSALLQPTAVAPLLDFGGLPWNSSAILLWLPEGEKPSGTEHFCCGAQLSPPACNPMAWWNLGQALTHAGTNPGDHGKQPWIKAGEVILSSADVLRSYDFYKHHGTRK